jgi:hypothetical protein
MTEIPVLRLFFVSGWFVRGGVAVQLQHRLTPLSVDHLGQDFHGLPDIVFYRNAVVLARVTQHIVCNFILVARVSDTNPQTVKIIGTTQAADNVTHAIVAAMSATRF